MIKISLYSKSGDNGYYDYDGCNLLYGELEMDCLPVIGQILDIKLKDLNIKCLVKEIVTEVREHGIFHSVYVLELK